MKTILVLLLLFVFATAINKELAVYFNLLDDNGNGVVTADEVALFLDRFHEEHETIVTTSEIWENLETRTSLYKILNATNVHIFGRKQQEWSLTMPEFEQTIQNLNKVRVLQKLIFARFATALMWTPNAPGKCIKHWAMTLNTKWSSCG